MDNDTHFVLQLLHFSDAEAGLLASSTAPILGALIDRFDGEYDNTLVLSGGDNFIAGPFMTAGGDPSLASVIGAAGPGRPDIAILNALGVAASGQGAGEWDLGSAVLAAAVGASGAYPGALFPYLAANLDHGGDAAIGPLAAAGGQDVSAVAGRFAPSATVQAGGQTIGLVGATTQLLERISSPTGTEVEGYPKAGADGDGQEAEDLALLAEQVQAEVDALIEQGIDKIVLLSHLRDLDKEKELAGLLKGVDVILAAGSDTAMGDAGDAAFPGREFSEGYPYLTQGADGGDTLIVSTAGEYSYLGRLVVEFDAEGRIVLDALDEAVNGAYAATRETLEAVYGEDIGDAFAEDGIGARVQAITDAVQTVIDAKDGTVYGYADVYLEGGYASGQFQETNLGGLSSDANAWAARAAVGEDAFLVAIKNGGAIAAGIGAVDADTGEKTANAANPDAGKPAGGISQLDLESALNFNDALAVFDTTPQGLLNILNYGASLAPGDGGYPQVGGLAFSYDPALPAGERVRDVALYDARGNKVALYDDGELLDGAPQTITVVTLNFFAQDGDGYPIQANGSNFRFLLDDGTLSAPVDWADLMSAAPGDGLTEQQALAGYLAEFHGTPDTAYAEADTDAAGDERIQNLSARPYDTVLDGTPAGPTPIIGGDEGGELVGTDGDDRIVGGAGRDTLEGGAGDDVLDGGAGLAYARFGGSADAYEIVLGEDGLPASVSGPDGSDTLIDVERLMFDDKILAFDLDGAPGQVYRLYEAAFGRAPDLEGISYWTRELDEGGDLPGLVRSFVNSDEFAAIHGDLPDLTDESLSHLISNQALVDLFYGAVLGRAADAAGEGYWVGQLDAGMPRAALVALFSESAEHREAIDPQLVGGVELDPGFFG